MGFSVSITCINSIFRGVYRSALSAILFCEATASRLSSIVTIEDSREAVASQNNIALNALLYTPRNIELMHVIETEKPILEKNDGSSGKFTAADLDTYLGTFDIILGAYERGRLTMS